MSTPTLQEIALKPSSLKAIERKARRQGKTTAEYVRWLIERDLLADKPFGEILKPIRDDFRASGVTEDQLDRIVERARTATHRKAKRVSR